MIPLLLAALLLPEQGISAPEPAEMEFRGITHTELWADLQDGAGWRVRASWPCWVDTVGCDPPDDPQGQCVEVWRCHGLGGSAVAPLRYLELPAGELVDFTLVAWPIPALHEDPPVTFLRTWPLVCTVRDLPWPERCEWN